MSGKRSWPALVGAGVLALCLPVAFVVALSKAGIPILPSASAPAPATTPGPSLAPLAVLSDSPATLAVTSVLNQGPGAPWLPSAEVDWAVGTPYDYACQLTTWKGPRAAVSGQRTFQSASGTITVSAHAYSAGAGALAFDQLSQRIAQCPQRESSVSSQPVSVGGANGLIGQVRPKGSPSTVTSVVWRRGDVVLDVHASGVPYPGLIAAAQAVDAAATTAIEPVCASMESTVEDALRSPWIDPKVYTGWLAPETIAIAPSPLPTPAAGVLPRDLTAPLEPLPQVSEPSATPSEPLWPPAPAPVVTPVLPSPVAAQPSATTVGVPRRDDAGPGCGWAFTGQTTPTFDEASALAIRTDTIAKARAALIEAQKEWQGQVQKYWAAASAYEAGLGQYRLYAAKIAQVTRAWASLQAARDVYALALAQWQRAVADRTVLVTAQQQAARDYQAAVDACLIVPTPTPSSTTTATTTASPTASPTVDPTVSPSPSVAPTVVCPPTRPPVLDQTLPPIPPTPTPPPDPRPSASVSTPTSR